jgi:hypothetical protein
MNQPPSLTTASQALPSTVTSWNLAFLHAWTASHHRSVTGQGPVQAVIASGGPSPTDNRAGSADTSPRPVTITGTPALSVTWAGRGAG